jgi:DNA repair protein RadA/Sms
VKRSVGKAKLQYVCQNCAYASPKWLGKCPSCGEWNTFVEEVQAPAPSAAVRRTGPPTVPVPITEVPESEEPRSSTGLGELDRVLGGGLVAGSLVLVGGDPGIGKSTLLTMVGHHLAVAAHRVLYVSGEESAAQIKLRAQRLGAASPHLLVLAETDLEAILSAAEQTRPQAIVIDSIQTVYTPSLPSAPGSVAQVRESTAELLRFAKGTGTAVLLVGHVTKEGQIAGPRVLEHIVDTVLYFEGDRQHAYRILRATKNRFGSTNEIGVFEMRPEGLREVPNPSAAFLSERAREAPGSAVVCALEGSRPLLVEVQALVTTTVFGMPRRTASGVDYNRMVVLLAVLEKRAGLHLGSQDVYVSVAGGMTVDEPAVDLGMAAAVASSLRNRPVDESVVAIGEVGLAGELRAVPQVAKRLQEAARLGFRLAVVPHQGAPERTPDGLEVVAADSVAEALARLVT